MNRVSGADGETTHDDGRAGGSGVYGEGSKVGQILLAKVKDLGSPGVAVDHITWKWFSASTAPVQL